MTDRLLLNSRILIPLVMFCIAVLFSVCFEPDLGWIMSKNNSSSLPNYMFVVTNEKNNIQKGDLIAFRKAPKAMLIIKKVIGIEGDRILIEKDKLFINDQMMGLVFTKTRGGMPLNPLQDKVVPKGKYFVWTPHLLSFDSRYNEMGLISLNQIQGKAYGS